MSDELNIGIGTKEPVTLKPAKVQILEAKIVPVPPSGKMRKEGQKVVCLIKHPDKADPVEISGAKIIKGMKIQESGLWLNKDEDGKIAKNSPLAALMQKCGATTLKDLVGKSLETEHNMNGFLCFKMY